MTSSVRRTRSAIARPGRTPIRAFGLGLVAIAAVAASACEPVPAPTGPPAVGSFPTAANTGVPVGTTLKSSGPITVTKDGTVIENLNITGTLTINANNVTVRNTKVTSKSWNVIRVEQASKNTVIHDVEIDGMGNKGGTNSMGVFGPASVMRSNIHGVENGLTPFSDSIIAGNYIHHLAAPNGPNGIPHYDGIQIDGGFSNIHIFGNTIDLREHDQTGAIMIDNYFGPIKNVVVDSNRLLGGSSTVYSDGQFSGGPITGVKYTNNRLGKGYWCYTFFKNNTPVFTGNIDDTTGAPIRPDC